MITARTSRFPGFYKVTVAGAPRARRARPPAWRRMRWRARSTAAGIDADTADKFVENVLGTYALPFGVALNVRVNGHDHVVPMVVEEPSVVAAASNAAKMIRSGGGFHAEVDASLMIGQIQLVNVEDAAIAATRLRAQRKGDPRARRPGRSRGSLRAAAARARSRSRVLGEPADRMIVVHVIVDCRDAMGANLVNTRGRGGRRSTRRNRARRRSGCGSCRTSATGAACASAAASRAERSRPKRWTARRSSTGS